MRLIPFTKSWQERRKARKQSFDNRLVQPAELSNPQKAPIEATAAQVVTQTETLVGSQKPKEQKKSLAQYGHHDNKGAVGRVAPTQTPYRDYPQRQVVGEHKVLAQYGHHDDKWAVKHPVY